MMNGMMGMGWFGPGIGWIFMILWWGLIIIGIVALVRWLMPSKHGRSGQTKALDILDEGFARGDIDSQEYEERRRILARPQE